MGEQSAVQHAPGEQLPSDQERPEVGMSFQQHTVLTTAGRSGAQVGKSVPYAEATEQSMRSASVSG